MSGPLTPGDPLGGGAEEPRREEPPPRPQAPRPEAPRPEAPPSASPYGSGPVPPGALSWERPSREATVSLPPASYGKRVVATLIDAAIIGVLTAAIIGAAGSTIGLFDDSEAGIIAFVLTMLAVVLVATVVAFLYAPVVMARTNGQTLGKMAMGMRVVRNDGKRVDFLWAAYREAVVKGLVLGVAAAITGGIAYLVDFLWPLADKQDRALHDFVVDSRVVAD
jgi:uncharacterized RDD family membrane protein YckC